MKVLMLSALLGIAGSAIAGPSKIVCTQDARPVDGILQVVTLERNANNTYDVSYTSSTSAWTGPEKITTVQIAKNIDHCNFSDSDARIINCIRTNRDQSEESNTGFRITKVVTTLAGLDDKDHTYENFELLVYSPQLVAGNGQEGFPHMESAGRIQYSYRSNDRSTGLPQSCVAN